MEGEEDLKDGELNARQKAFVERYCKSLNATQSAKDAGYSENTAAEMGYENLRKPHIRAAVDAKLKEMQLGPDEVKKSISDIAKSSLNEFFTIKKVEYTPRIEVTLAQFIQSKRDEIDFEEEFADRAGYSEEENNKLYEWKQERLREIIRLEIELERYPTATRFVNGPTQWIETAELDLVKIVQAYERGRIKSYSMTKEGPKIEMYAADAALRDLARMHGLFIDKVETSGSVTLNFDKDDAKL